MDNFVGTYKKIDKEVRERVSRDMVNVMGLDNMIYGTIHAMVCECMDKNIPRSERRTYILDRINLDLDKWVD